MPVSSYLVTDELTVLLGLIAASTFLLRNLYKPQPLVHPILLGRQSDASRVRNPGESAAYRNYGTGMMGRFPMRPSKDVNVLLDLLKPDLDSPRTLWSTKITNNELKARVSALGTGLIRKAGLSKESNVLLLLNDSTEFLITDLALASHSIPSFTLSSLSLLSDVLESHPPSAIVTHAAFLPQLLELIYDSAEHEHHTVIVVGEPADGIGLDKMKDHVNVVSWSELESEGSKIDQVVGDAPDPNGVFTVSFYRSASGRLEASHLTHENVTAGVAAARTLLPLSNAISPLDTIISAHSLSTAFGRAVAYTALYEGTSFATLQSTRLLKVGEDAGPVTDDLEDLTEVTKHHPIPSPTILFIKPTHLTALTSAILASASKSFWYPIARRHKLAALAEGFVSKDGLWDRAVFDGARSAVVGDGAGSVRGVIVCGADAPPARVLPEARMALSVPLVLAHAHPVVAGPVFASHPLDLQVFPADAAGAYAGAAPVGPPSINIDAKLLGVADAAVEAGQDPEGRLYVRGPSVGKVEVIGEEAEAEDDEGWVAMGERAKVATNGCFRIASAA